MNAEQYKADFLRKLKEEERAPATCEKYSRDIKTFLVEINRIQKMRSEQETNLDADLQQKQDARGQADLRSEQEENAEKDTYREQELSFADALDRETILLYKERLKKRYAAASTNSMLVAMNRFLSFIGRADLHVSLLRTQRRMFRDERKELTREEYIRLLKAARKKKDKRLFLLMETICSTGIRVSEHQFITVESLKQGFAEIENKGRTRTIVLDRHLCLELKDYCRKMHIESGPVFRSTEGRPLNRCNIWKMMKQLSSLAGVAAEKIFPHNLRHLFAVTFYRMTRDIVHLADQLGHASIDTTRIYTSISISEHKTRLSQMKLLLC